MTTEEINAIANASINKELSIIRLLTKGNGRIGDAARIIINASERVSGAEEAK